jgi:nucleotide-binding universal stress UspA family protein
MSAYKRILTAVDGSRASNQGLREAIRLAKAERARLFVLHVVDEYPAFALVDGLMGAAITTDMVGALREGGKRVLAKALALSLKHKLQAKGILRERIGGPAAGPIVGEARKVGADLIVLGTHGRRGMRRMVLGSDAELVVRTARVPVLLVRSA